jgi:hypothetical protein
VIAVVTTIRGPTADVRTLARALDAVEGRLFVVGDRKGPQTYDCAGSRLISFAQQHQGRFELGRRLPANHYARKNLGYLEAVALGAPCVYETDDDTAPQEGWRPRPLRADVQPLAPRSWVNVCRLYTDELIWPRGFPLELVRSTETWSHNWQTPQASVEAPLQTGLVDGSPDVDAIWRLVLNKQIRFQTRPSVYVPPRTWTPVNSQNTWWYPAAYPFLYLPSCCSMRMTDILRGFVAQRCLWELGAGVVYHAADVFQDRSPHDLMRDFQDETVGYHHTREITNCLAELNLTGGTRARTGNLELCYRALVAQSLLPSEELDLLAVWLSDLAAAHRESCAP